jgi:MraZ protein
MQHGFSTITLSAARKLFILKAFVAKGLYEEPAPKCLISLAFLQPKVCRRPVHRIQWKKAGFSGFWGGLLWDPESGADGGAAELSAALGCHGRRWQWLGVVQAVAGNLIFTGGPVITLDPKGRISVPVRYREPLLAEVQGRLTVSKNRAGALSLFPRPVWERFEAQLLGLDMAADDLKRLYLGSATPLEMDAAGRLLLPPELRAWAGLDREVVFMGMGTTIELWDHARQLEREAIARANGSLDEHMKGLVIR